MSGIGTRQHHVPQFYLRFFGDNPSKKHPRLHVVDVSNPEEVQRFCAATNKIAVEKGFYDHELNENVTATLDPALTRFEQEVAPAVQKLVRERDTSCLTLEERTFVGTFVLAQHLRGPGTRADVLKFDRTFEAVLRAVGIEPAERWPDYQPAEETVVLDHMEAMRQIVPEHAGEFVVRPWLLFHAPPGLEFATSDHPVIRQNPWSGGNQGLRTSGTELTIALASTLLLVIVDPSVDSRQEWLGTRQLHPEAYETYQRWVVTRAVRHVFSRSPMGIRGSWLQERPVPSS